MKKMLSTLICALTLLALLCSLAVPAVVAISTSAEAPVWVKGDKWAYGMENDVGADFGAQLQEVKDLLEGETGGTVNTLELDGSSGFWILFEVTEANSDIYVLSMDAAVKLQIDASISVTAEMEKAGTYSYDQEPETESMDIEIEANVDLALVVGVDITFERDTMAISEITMNVNFDGVVAFTAQNIPSSETNWTDYSTTISYDDYDVSAEMEANLAMEISFEPALNIWDFPLEYRDEWSVNSEATISGSMTGMLDVNGLPQDMSDELFTDEFIESTGFSDFPIIFEQLNSDDGDWPFQDGMLEEVSEDVEMTLKCTSVITVQDEYWGEITVYKIEAQGTPLEFYYSPDVGFMSYFSMNSDDLDDIFDLNVAVMPSEEFRMEAVDPAVAADNINEISDYQGSIGPDGQGGIAGFFLDAPYLGLILIGIIVVVVVASILLIRKK
ncbi:MAG TPA: hypothetical protein VMW85_07135 [Methanomassiliicoccales archaeon]|nr:hypothetical protein [Methanomassiliicoccales archaeon]